MELLGSLRLFAHLLRFRLKGGSPRNYEKQWDSYWRTVDSTGQGGQVLWDNVPERAAAEDLIRFKRHVDDSSLPLLDIGCGNGRQTRFLARHFQKVVGVDISAAAVELARRETARETNVEYRLLDGTNPRQALELHEELGDCNIYMRGVFHCVQQKDRPAFVRSLEILLGERGGLYLIELQHGALSVLRKVPGNTSSGLPKLVHNVVKHGIRPIGFNPKDREVYYPESRWRILGEGHEVAINTVLLADGQEIQVPASYLILRPRTARSPQAVLESSTRIEALKAVR
ncbi:MAG TPA: class I SAM-dependent methyltransferase [Thermoanaerobaculia bacterium]|nr:class I SAM-dependent methyltransferase [Thermoanaerobaculia bacterium]